MPIRSYLYPAVRVDIVTLDPDQIVLYERSVLDDVLGTIFTAGTITSADDRSWAVIVNHVWRPRLTWETWKTPDGPHETEIQAGPSGAEWVCLSRTRGHGRMVRQLVEEPFIIPAAWGLVVASGSAVVGSQAGEQGNYFAPRDQDREVTGSGDLLLVR